MTPTLTRGRLARHGASRKGTHNGRRSLAVRLSRPKPPHPVTITKKLAKPSRANDADPSPGNVAANNSSAVQRPHAQ